MSDEREHLLGGSSRRWGIDESEDTQGLDNRDLMGLQQEHFTRQDDTLDLLGQSISRQKNIALAIDGELTDQDRLLDNLDAHVDKTGTRLKAATRKVEEVTLKSSTKALLWLICFLVLGFAVECFFAFGLDKKVAKSSSSN